MQAEASTHVNRSQSARQGEDLAARLAAEMVERWHAGDEPPAEVFFERFPELLQTPEAATRLIYEEFCLRQERGQAVSVEQFIRRFPQWRTQLAVLLDLHRLLEGPPPPSMPLVRESLGDYILLAELGRGAHGCVYLAGQPSLADRLVVLKVTPRAGREHLTLARLQHTHIVPLYSVHEDGERNLRTLCMPYFGGAALNHVLAALSATPPATRTGKQLLDALDRMAARAEAPLDTAATPARRFLSAATYVQAICWIGASLADALQYAHERGFVHLDLKPGNVLLASDGEPMLLDFHIAQKPLRGGDPLPADLGGTPAYMSPEQQRAMTAVSCGQPVAEDIDGRSDIYSLGLLLLEALGGGIPGDGRSSPRLQHSNSQISVGLADIIAKCLAEDPAERYATAAALAADLRRHLADLPLRGVCNRSLSERWSKWRRRRPNALLLGLMGAAVVAAVLAISLVAYDQLGRTRREAEASLTQGTQQLRSKSYRQATDTLARGRSIAQRLPFDREHLVGRIDGQLQIARRALAAEQLHSLVNRMRFLYDGAVPAGEAPDLAVRWRKIWEQRHVLHQRRDGELDAELERNLDIDLLDLGIVWADLSVRVAPAAESDAARREALRILDETESLYGASQAICRQREKLAATLRLKDLASAAASQAASLPPRTAWEYAALGRTLLAQEEWTQASEALQKAIEMQPQNFWARFHLGVCAYRQNRPQEAAAAFGTCIALAPSSAECYYNRALAWTALSRHDAALQDYDRALTLDSRLAAAFLNRGLLHFNQKRHAAALTDLKQALASGSDAAATYYNIALVYAHSQDYPAARANVRLALDANPQHSSARQLLEHLERR